MRLNVDKAITFTFMSLPWSTSGISLLRNIFFNLLNWEANHMTTIDYQNDYIRSKFSNGHIVETVTLPQKIKTNKFVFSLTDFPNCTGFEMYDVKRVMIER